MPGRTNQVTCDASGRIVDFEIQEGKGDMKQWILDVAAKWQPELAMPPVAVFVREGDDAGFFFRLVSGGQPFLSWEKHVDAQRLAAIEAQRFATEFIFKHLQERHPAHYQPGFKLIDSERQDIANPDLKLLEKQIRRLCKVLDKLYKQLTKTPPQTNREIPVRLRHRRGLECPQTDGRLAACVLSARQ